MSIDPVYVPTPITQRDGSSLANSNCRMASIATGLDYDTRGAKKSTGSKMRSYTSDQSGGTGSDDAKQAWSNGYSEALTIRDGYTFDNAKQDLASGAAVHLDVWHATCGGPCLSGSGAYGHTMFVLPDQHSDGRWKVADPWCSPAKWSWWSESKLRAGAEEWGRRVYGAAALEADYPADSSGPRDPRVLAIVARVARRMMSLSYPGHETTMPNPPPADTGGGQAILFTRTAALGVAGSGGGGTTVGINWNPSRWTLTKDVPVYLDTSGSQKVTTAKAGTVVTAFGVKAAIDDNGLDSSWRAILVSTGGLIPGDSAMQRAILWCKAADMPDDSTSTNQAWDDSIWNLAGTPEGRFPCPAAPPCPECPDQAEVIAARDEEWEEWVLNGAPSDATPATAGKPTP